MTDEEFSKANPLNERIKDTDIFLHGTSSINFEKIQYSRFLKRKPDEKNFSISENGVCFEKYDTHGIYQGMNSAEYVERYALPHHYGAACRKDKSPEAVILQINGKELKKLCCPICADWNYNYPCKRTRDYIRLDVDYDQPVISIIIVDKDIPFDYLKVFKRIPFED